MACCLRAQVHQSSRSIGMASKNPSSAALPSSARRRALRAGIAGALATPAIARAQGNFSWKMTSAYAQGRAVLHGRPRQCDRSRQAHRGDVERPTEDPGVRRRRADPGARGLRRGARRHGRDEPRQQLLLDRQDVRRAVLHRGAVRPELPGHQRLALRRRRPAAVERGLRAVRHGGDAVRQHRRADDRLVQEGDQVESPISRA